MKIVAGMGGLAIVCVCAVGCLEREVVEQEPSTSNIFVERQSASAIDKIDLLFVVDNSTSMADKQKIFEGAVPRMLERLVRPDCITLTADGDVSSRTPSVPPTTPGEDPSCPSGAVLEFRPVEDIHIGVISSSLGGRGSSSCSEAENDDRALLLPRVRPGLVDPHGTGYLVWRPQGAVGEPVEADLERLSGHFREHVLAAGESGCGFEAPLEAWYRFLVDPAPPLTITKANYKSSASGVDQDVLAQRAAFLRTDSLVAVVMLTDEDDCSIMNGSDAYPNSNLGWALAEFSSAFPDVGGGEHPRQFPVATSYCDAEPNHACCFSCFREDLPSGCSDTSALSACTSQAQPRLSPELDRANVRCFDTKRRFGVDLLYPIERYVAAIHSPDVPDISTGKSAPNPLLLGIDGKSARPPGLVFVAGITGLPWQDVADEASLTDPTRLEYLTATQLDQRISADAEGSPTRWEVLLGTETSPPIDPFMRPSVDPRSGTHPLTGDSITTGPTWNPINGYEQDPNIAWNRIGGTDALPARSDLQYSCIFPLEPYGGQESVCAPTDSACDCGYGDIHPKPLCQESPTTPSGTGQYYGKAYPAQRILSVLAGVGDNAIVSSICPKIHDPTLEDFGYNPAIAAIVDRLGDKLKGQCLPRQLGLDDDGRVPCEVVEVFSREVSSSCGEGRREPSALIQDAVLSELESSDYCSGAECDDLVYCAIDQIVSGAEREACLTGPLGSEADQAPGYCYVDPAQGLGSEQLVAACRASERQLLRFVGKDTPTPGSTVVVACNGEQPSTDGIPKPQ